MKFAAGVPKTPAFWGKRRSSGMSEAAISNAKHKESAASDTKLATPWRQYKRYFLPFALARRYGLARGAHGEIIAYMSANKKIRLCGFFYWRSRRDSNSRTAYHRHTISSRARYDRFDTAPCHNCIHNGQYYSRFVFKKQALFENFFLLFPKN